MFGRRARSEKEISRMRIQFRLRRTTFVLATCSALALEAPLALGATPSEPSTSSARSDDAQGADPARTGAAITADEKSATRAKLAPSEDPLGDIVQRPRQLGLMFDFGSLDGAMLSLVYRPLPWLRTYGGGGTNGAAPGIRVGASVAPFHQKNWALNLDGGHFFQGDVNGIFSAVAGAGYIASQALEHFDYDFVDLQAGWEAESNGLMFFVRGGVGFVWTQIPPDGLAHLRHVSSLVDADGSVQAFLPSVRVGLIGFF
jgi:hypothetical protein